MSMSDNENDNPCDPDSEAYDARVAHDRAWPVEAAERKAREAADAAEAAK